MNKNALLDGERVLKFNILIILIISSVQMLAGLLTGMTVVIADAVRSFSSILDLFAAYIGIKISRKDANKNFEYGYHKIETFAALLVSLGILYIGYITMVESINAFKMQKFALGHAFVITTTVISMQYYYRLSKKLEAAAEKTNSLAIAASAKNKKINFIIGLAVLLSIVANYKQVPYVEGVISVIISLGILKEGLWSTKQSLFFLLDYWDDPVLFAKIKDVLMTEKDIVIEVKRLRLRRAGSFIFGEAFIEMNPFAGVEDLRSELDNLKEKIKNLDPYIKDFAIYSHIPKLGNFVVAFPVKKESKLNSEIAHNLSETKSYLFVKIAENKIKKSYFKKLKDEDKNVIKLATFLNKEKVNVVINNELPSLAYYNLRRTHHVLIYPDFRDVPTVNKMMELILIDK